MGYNIWITPLQALAKDIGVEECAALGVSWVAIRNGDTSTNDRQNKRQMPEVICTEVYILLLAQKNYPEGI
jgi:Lhr-like helicase